MDRDAIRRRAAEYESARTAELSLLDGQLRILSKHKNTLQLALEESEKRELALRQQLSDAVQAGERERREAAARESELRVKMHRLEVTHDDLQTESDVLEQEMAQMLERYGAAERDHEHELAAAREELAAARRDGRVTLQINVMHELNENAREALSERGYMSS